MKKLLSFLFASMLAIQVWAYDFQSGNLYYNITSDSTVEVTYPKYNDGNYYSGNAKPTGNLTIPQLVSVDNRAYIVTSIGDCAFYGCDGLKSINIPECVTNIGGSAFSNCGSLTSINIPKFVKGIGGYAFFDCSNLTSVTIPNFVTSIGDCAFYGCTALATVTIPNSVDIIGDNVFGGCDNLRYNEYGNALYLGNAENQHIALIKAKSTDITSCEIDNNCKFIFKTAFDGCNNLQYNEYANALYLGNAENLYIALIKAKSTDITSCEINSNCKFVYQYAFINCIGLTSLSIPNSVLSIGRSAFYGCSGLTSVCLSNSMKSVSYGTFSNCSSLMSITIPNSVTSIEGDAFENCDNLKSITIPNTVTYINDNAFSGCFNIESLSFDTDAVGTKFGSRYTLKTITVGNSVKKIESNAFAGCNNLETLTIGSSVTSIGPSAFGRCSKLETLTFNTNAIGSYFKDKTSLKTINIGDSVTEIAEKAFSGCTGLITITVGNSIQSIGSDAFKNCNKIDYNVFDNAYYIGNNDNPYIVLMKAKNKSNTSCSINDKCKIIYYKAFEYCGLTELQIPNSIISIGGWSFYACGDIKKINISDSVTNIGDYAFGYCSGLTSVDIPNSVTNIGENAFLACSSLNTVSIGNSVTNIGASAFSNCYGLKTVTIGYSVSNIGGNAFNNCSINRLVCWGTEPAELDGDPFPKSDTVYVPATSVDTYKAATYWKRKEILPFGIVSVNSEDETMGTVLGDSILLYDSSITITAIPKEGCHFAKWSDENTDNPRVCSTANDTSFTAIFEAHTEVVDSAIGATCTTTGLTEGSHCSVCGKVLVAQNKIPMVEHTAVVDAAVAATATETGLTEGSHCSVCGKVIVAQEVIPALGEQGGGNENNPGTIVAESAAHTIHIYSYDNKIVVENATDEIRIYDAMGRIVSRDVASNVSTITVNTPGIYIVRIGNNAKRVFVNW